MTILILIKCTNIFKILEFIIYYYFKHLKIIFIGALICGMDQTVKGILQNYLYLIKKFGYVLSRNRVYYEGRSEPPLLIQMMATYYMYTKDQQFLIDNIKVYNDKLRELLISFLINVN